MMLLVIFSILDSKVFGKCFSNWVSSVAKLKERELFSSGVSDDFKDSVILARHSCLRRNDALNKKSASLILPFRKFYTAFFKPSNPHIKLIYTYLNGYEI